MQASFWRATLGGFSYALYDRLPRSPITRGALWGVVLWLLAQLIVMPMMGGGLFSSAMGGAMAVMGSLVGHLMYGGLLGAIASAPKLGTAHA